MKFWCENGYFGIRFWISFGAHFGLCPGPGAGNVQSDLSRMSRKGTVRVACFEAHCCVFCMRFEVVASYSFLAQRLFPKLMAAPTQEAQSPGPQPAAAPERGGGAARVRGAAASQDAQSLTLQLPQDEAFQATAVVPRATTAVSATCRRVGGMHWLLQQVSAKRRARSAGAAFRGARVRQALVRMTRTANLGHAESAQPEC